MTTVVVARPKVQTVASRLGAKPWIASLETSIQRSTEGPEVIEVRNLTKRYGSSTAVDNLSFDVNPGMVTGFLGPNGSGKSTTMGLIVGLETPTRGSATIHGRPYRKLPAPLFAVGTMLDARSSHPGRSARTHLRCIAATHGIGKRRVSEVLDLVGLHDAAKKRVGTYSLGMTTRLGIAGALLGDPDVLILDEPLNGLDNEGVRWLRRLLRSQAAAGKAVFLSSHVLPEMAQTADHIIVIKSGRLLANETLEEFTARTTAGYVRVRTPHLTALTAALTAVGASFTPGASDGVVQITNMRTEQVAQLAEKTGVTLYELVEQRPSLEQAFIATTAQRVRDFSSQRTSDDRQQTIGLDDHE